MVSAGCDPAPSEPAAHRWAGHPVYLAASGRLKRATSTRARRASTYAYERATRTPGPLTGSEPQAPAVRVHRRPSKETEVIPYREA